MILLVGHYEEAQPQRAAEYREALRRNVANEHIECIRLLIEDGTSAELLRARGEPYDNAKVQIASQGKRLTFDALFSMAERDWSGYPVIMANADIAFDDTLAMLEDVALQGSLLCLSRWNESADGRLDHFDAPNSQDAWIFEPPLPAIACAFELGTPGCDNRLAHEASRAGLRVLNPSRSLRSAHLHNSQVRNYTQRQRLPGPYRFVPASFLGDDDADDSRSAVHHSSHRARQVADRARRSARGLETLLRERLGTPLPPPLRKALRDAVAHTMTPLQLPAELPLAELGFREAMGYGLQRMALGVSTHGNDQRPIASLPEALQGLWFTQVVANHAAPVAIEFMTTGRAFVLSGRGWYGHDIAAAYLDQAGWRNEFGSVRTTNDTVFDVWTLAGVAGERLTVPTQVMLASAALLRLP